MTDAELRAASEARALIDNPANWHGEVEHFRRVVPVLLATVDRIRADLEIVGPPEPPAEVFTAPDGPPVPCEVCCAPIAPRSAVASWVDEGRHVVAHARRCPEPEMWFIEYVPRSSRRRDWMRVCDGSTGDDLVRPYEEALYRARDLGARTRVRLVRAKAVRP